MNSEIGELIKRIWHCNLDGWPDKRKKLKEIYISRKRDRKTAKCGRGCKAQAKRDKISDEWILETLESEHNHGPLSTLSAAPVFCVCSLSDE